MAEQKAAARAAWKGSGEKASDELWFDLAEELGATEFTGYTSDSGEGVVLALIKDGHRVEQVGAGEQVDVIVNQTPFYAESGGQVGDAATVAAELTKRNLNFKEPQRYKGLGEMDAHQLAETTMDRSGRLLRRVRVQDAEAVSGVFELLMGSDVAPRRDFIVTSSDRLDRESIDA